MLCCGSNHTAADTLAPHCTFYKQPSLLTLFPLNQRVMSRAFPTCTSCRVRLLPGCQKSSQASGPHCCHCCCCHCCLQTCPLVPGWCPATVLQAGGCPGTPTTCTAQRVTAWGSTHVNATHSTHHAPRHSNSVRVLHKPWPRINVQHRIATRPATGLALVV